MSHKCGIQQCIITSPIGHVTLMCCEQGLHSVHQVHFHEHNFQPAKDVNVEIVDSTSGINVVERPAVVMETVHWFEEYFADPQKTANMELPTICSYMCDGSFREKVRKALVQHVKCGETISYGDLAKLVSNKGASRAVGSAMSNNPFSIMVPCHRVIKSDGTLGNYGKSCRNEIKKWLLQFEGVNLK